MIGRRGFTLIEVLIVSVIMIVVTGLSLAAYRNFNETRKLEEVVKAMVVALETAKKKAITGNFSFCTNGGNFTWLSWGSPKQYFYVVFSTCAAAFVSDAHWVSLPKNFELNPMTGMVKFLPLALGTNANPTITITIKNVTTNKTKSIVVDKAGNINVQ